MNLAELIGGPIIRTGPATPLDELATLMHDQGVGSVAIIDGSDEFVGIVTDRDIVEAVARRADLTTPTNEVMTLSPDTVETDTDVIDAVRWLNATGYRHLPVTDGGSLVGVVSIKDLLWAISDN